MVTISIKVFSREEAEEAARYARKAVDRINYQQGIFFTDGSFNPKNERSAYAYICHQALGQPSSQVYPLKPEDNYYIHDIAGAEMKAVLAALKAAHKYRCKEVRIFFDAIAVMHGVRAYLNGEAFSENSNSLTREFSEDLRQATEGFDKIEFVQIPSHVGIEFHDQVDRLIKKFAGKLKPVVEMREVEVVRAQQKEDMMDQVGNHVFLLDTRQETPMGIYIDRKKRECRVLNFSGEVGTVLPLGRLQQFLLVQTKKLYREYQFAKIDFIYNETDLRAQVGEDSFFDFMLKQHTVHSLGISWHFQDKALGNLFNRFMVEIYQLVADDFFLPERRKEPVVVEKAGSLADAEAESAAREPVVYSTQAIDAGDFIPGELELKDYFGCQREDIQLLSQDWFAMEDMETSAVATMRTFITNRASKADIQWVDGREKKRLGRVIPIETKAGKREANTEAIRHILVSMAERGVNRLLMILSDKIYYQIVSSNTYYVGSEFNQLDQFARSRGIELVLVGSDVAPDFQYLSQDLRLSLEERMATYETAEEDVFEDEALREVWESEEADEDEKVSEGADVSEAVVSAEAVGASIGASDDVADGDTVRSSDAMTVDGQVEMPESEGEVAESEVADVETTVDTVEEAADLPQTVEDAYLPTTSAAKLPVVESKDQLVD